MPENGSGNDIDHLQISIEASAGKAASGIDKLATALSKLSAAAIPIKGSLFSDLADGLKPLAELKLSSVGSTIRAIVMLSKNIGDLENLRDIDPTVFVTLAEALRTLGGIKLSGIGSVLREVRQIPETLEKLSKVDISQYAEKLQALTAALEPLALHAKDIVGAFTAIGKTTIKIYPDGASVNEQQKKAVEKATFDYSRLGHVLSTLAKPFNKAASAAGNFLKKLGSRVIHAFTGRIERLATGVHRLFNSIRRVVLMRAIRAVLRQITAGFKEGIDNLYQWSALVDGRFKASMDKIATSMLYLKNSLAAMVSPIINKLAPAIDWLVDRFVDLLNIINQVFSALTGSDTWTKAIKYPVEYAEGMADAAKSTKEAAKELKLFLLPFDELNVLTKDNPASDSSPGGAGQSGLNYAEMFETRELEDWAKRIKDLIDQGDWYGAGAALADHLNGIIERWDSEAWGKELAAKLNHGIQFALGFMRTFGWETLGDKFGSFLNGFTLDFDWESFGALLATPTNAVSAFLKGMFKRFNGSEFGKGLGKLFNGWVKEMNVQDIIDAIELGIEDATQIVKAFFDTADPVELANKISEILCNMDWKQIWTEVWEVAKSALKFTWHLGETLLDNLWNGGEYTTEEGQTVTINSNKGLVVGGGILGAGALGVAGISGLLGLVGKLLPLIKLFTGGGGAGTLANLGIPLLGTLLYAGALAGVGGGSLLSSVLGVGELEKGNKLGLSGLLGGLGGTVGLAQLGPLAALFPNNAPGSGFAGLAGGTILGALLWGLDQEGGGSFEKLLKVLQGITDESGNANTSISDFFETIFGNADPAKDKLSDIATEESKTATTAKKAARDIETSFQGLPKWFYDLWENIKKPFVDAWESIKKEFNTRLDNIKKDFNDFKDFVETGFKKPIEDIFGNLGAAIVYLVEGDFGKAVASAQRAINGLITVAESAINLVIRGFNQGLFGPFNQASADLYAATGGAVNLGQITGIPEVSLGRIQNIAAADEFMQNVPAASKGIGGDSSGFGDMLGGISAVFGDGSSTQNVNVYLDGEQIANNSVKYINRSTVQNGKSPLLA